MIFPTVQFALFFAVVLPLSWALMPRQRLWRPFILAASYYFYAAADWHYVFLLAGSTVVNQTRRHRYRPPALREGPQGGADHRDHPRPRHAGRLQISGLLQRLHQQLSGTLPRAAPSGPACRRVLLHLPGDLLRRGRPPRPHPAGQAARLRHLRVLLPAPRRRTDRPRGGVRPAAVQSARPEQHPGRSRLRTDRRRSGEEDGRRRHDRHEAGRAGVRHASGPQRHRNAHGDLRIRRPDLLRLLRLHRYGDRPGAATRLPLPRQLRPPLHRPLSPGLLATLAYDAVPLAPRLPLHPLRREPRREL